jgi:hypothetical protein
MILLLRLNPARLSLVDRIKLSGRDLDFNAWPASNILSSRFPHI